MQRDLRTEAEKRYDATALSRPHDAEYEALRAGVFADVKAIFDDIETSDPLLYAARWLDSQSKPTAPVVRMEHRTDMDVPCIEFTCGGVLVEISDEDGAMWVYGFGGDCRPLAEAEQDSRDLTSILNDPRFQAIRGLPPTPPAAPAVRTENWYSDPDNGGDLTQEPCGPLVYVDYICGEGRSEAAISIDVRDGSFGHARLADEAIDGLDALKLAMPNMLIILSDPRVQAMLAHEAEQLLKQAA